MIKMSKKSGWFGESKRHSEAAKKGKLLMQRKKASHIKQYKKEQSLNDKKIKNLREQYIKDLVKTNTKEELYIQAKSLKIKYRSEMNKEQLAHAVETEELVQAIKDRGGIIDYETYYTNKIELHKLWVKYYNKETGEGTDKYLQACKEYFASK